MRQGLQERLMKKFLAIDIGVNASACAWLILALTAPAHAQILKCVDVRGNVEFSNQSCQPGWKRQELAIKENTVTSLGAREQALLEENKRLKDQLQSTRSDAGAGSAAAANPAPALVLTEADFQAQRQRSSACDDAARRYEIAAGSIAPQTELIAARRSTMFAICGIREPDTVQVITNVQTETPRPCLLWGQRMQRSPITGLVVSVCTLVITCTVSGSRMPQAANIVERRAAINSACGAMEPAAIS